MVHGETKSDAKRSQNGDSTRHTQRLENTGRGNSECTSLKDGASVDAKAQQSPYQLLKTKLARISSIYTRKAMR